MGNELGNSIKNQKGKSERKETKKKYRDSSHLDQEATILVRLCWLTEELGWHAAPWKVWEHVGLPSHGHCSAGLSGSSTGPSRTTCPMSAATAYGANGTGGRGAGGGSIRGTSVHTPGGAPGCTVGTWQRQVVRRSASRGIPKSLWNTVVMTRDGRMKLGQPRTEQDGKVMDM